MDPPSPQFQCGYKISERSPEVCDLMYMYSGLCGLRMESYTGITEIPSQHTNVVLELKDKSSWFHCSVGLLEGNPLLQPAKARQISRTATADNY